jgi:hypothetical protein
MPGDIADDRPTFEKETALVKLSIRSKNKVVKVVS